MHVRHFQHAEENKRLINIQVIRLLKKIIFAKVTGQTELALSSRVYLHIYIFREASLFPVFQMWSCRGTSVQQDGAATMIGRGYGVFSGYT